MVSYRRNLRILLLLLFVCVTPVMVGAQEQASEWSYPLRLFELSPDDGGIYDPLVVTDAMGSAHVFWLVRSNGRTDIYHVVMDNGLWSEPVDILINAGVFSAAVDATNNIHLLWTRGNRLLYTWSPADQAGSPWSWSRPIPIAEANIRTHIVAGPDEKLHVAYSSPGGKSVYYMISEDSGNNWGNPLHVSAPLTINGAMDDVRITVGKSGTIHLVWTEYELPNGWPPLGVFYTHSTDGGLTWSIPYTIAGEGYDEGTVAIVEDNFVHVAWNGRVGINGRYHRWSSDGGNTWSATNVISERGGTEGFPNLVVDSGNKLHLLTTYYHAWYTTWTGEDWLEPVRLSNEETYGGYVEEATMAISEGNRLHAVYWGGRQQLWYTTRQIESPWVAPSFEPSPTPLPAIPSFTPTPPAPEVSRLSGSLETIPEPDRVTRPELSLIVSLLPAVILLGGVVFWSLVWRRRN